VPGSPDGVSTCGAFASASVSIWGRGVWAPPVSYRHRRPGGLWRPRARVWRRPGSHRDCALVCLAVLDGVPAAEAVAYVREHYGFFAAKRGDPGVTRLLSWV